MTERHLIVDHLRFSYEGLFDAGELYNVISSWFFEKKYDWYEKLNQEQATPKGKQIRIILEPWKNVSDYYQLKIKVKINFLDLNDVEVDADKQKLKLNHGVVRITYDGYLIGDRYEKWHNQPFYWFLSIIFEKYFFRNTFNKFKRWIESDVEDLHEQVKTYLNVYKYKTY
tara:strand:+ start:26658 stop:27167 length:510 start_codon:yes stop_codon:yes gene_type:complete